MASMTDDDVAATDTSKATDSEAIKPQQTDLIHQIEQLNGTLQKLLGSNSMNKKSGIDRLRESHEFLDKTMKLFCQCKKIVVKVKDAVSYAKQIYDVINLVYSIVFGDNENEEKEVSIHEQILKALNEYGIKYDQSKIKGYLNSIENQIYVMNKLCNNNNNNNKNNTNTFLYDLKELYQAYYVPLEVTLSSLFECIFDGIDGMAKEVIRSQNVQDCRKCLDCMYQTILLLSYKDLLFSKISFMLMSIETDDKTSFQYYHNGLKIYEKLKKHKKYFNTKWEYLRFAQISNSRMAYEFAIFDNVKQNTIINYFEAELFPTPLKQLKNKYFYLYPKKWANKGEQKCYICIPSQKRESQRLTLKKDSRHVYYTYEKTNENQMFILENNNSINVNYQFQLKFNGKNNENYHLSGNLALVYSGRKPNKFIFIAIYDTNKTLSHYLIADAARYDTFWYFCNIWICECHVRMHQGIPSFKQGYWQIEYAN